MRLIAILGLMAVLAFSVWLLLDTQAIAAWAADQQRGFQNQMAGAIRALRAGDSGALSALLLAAGAYGFAHAVGPGHGKALIGAVGAGTSVPATRLLGIALVSSLAQALWAILLVYGGFTLLDVSARQMTTLAEDILAPASFLAIAVIGGVLFWRGVGSLFRRARIAQHGVHSNAHHQGACGCHAHGPSHDEVAKLGSVRDAAVLVASIAIRPCSGAIFLLVIAWQMDIRAAGAAAVVVMGLGTAIVTSAVGVSSIAARGVTWASADRWGVIALALPAVQALAGVFLISTSLIMLGAS